MTQVMKSCEHSSHRGNSVLLQTDLNRKKNYDENDCDWFSAIDENKVFDALTMKCLLFVFR